MGKMHNDFQDEGAYGLPVPFSAYHEYEMPYSRIKFSVAKNNLDSVYIRSMCFLGSENVGLRTDNLKVDVIMEYLRLTAAAFARPFKPFQ
jgi:hypothetical protein